MNNLEYLYRGNISDSKSLVLKTFHPDNALAITHFDDENAPVSDENRVDCAFTDDMEIQEAVYYHKISGKLKNERSHLMVDYERKSTDSRILAKMIEALIDEQTTIKLMPRSCDIAELSQGNPYRFREILLGIAAANNILNRTSHIPPIRDLIIPQVSDKRVLKSARATISALRKAFPDIHKDLSGIKLVPLIENTNALVNIRENVLTHIDALRGDSFEEYTRVMLAMSDTSMESGTIATMISLRYALAEIYRYAAEKNTTILPILGGGTLPFRGLQTPENICNLLKNLPASQITIQSAMTFDYGETDITHLYDEIIRSQETHLQDIQTIVHDVSPENAVDYRHLQGEAEKEYWNDLLLHSADGLSLPMLLALKNVNAPMRRNRVGISTGGAGRDKLIAGKKFRFHRAISHVFGLLSIGLGSGTLYGASYLKTMQKQYPQYLDSIHPILSATYQKDLELSSEKITAQAEETYGFQGLTKFVQQRKAIIKDVFGIEPQTNEVHEKHLADSLQHWKNKKLFQCRLSLQKAAIERKAIG
jgi:phosphoenolpyruvate carboxylase